MPFVRCLTCSNLMKLSEENKAFLALVDRFINFTCLHFVHIDLIMSRCDDDSDYNIQRSKLTMICLSNEISLH